jgi:hypothetical protein
MGAQAPYSTAFLIHGTVGVHVARLRKNSRVRFSQVHARQAVAPEDESQVSLLLSCWLSCLAGPHSTIAVYPETGEGRCAPRKLTVCTDAEGPPGTHRAGMLGQLD